MKMDFSQLSLKGNLCEKWSKLINTQIKCFLLKYQSFLGLNKEDIQETICESSGNTFLKLTNLLEFNDKFKQTEGVRN